MKRKLNRCLICFLLSFAFMSFCSNGYADELQTADSNVLKKNIPADATGISPLLIGATVPPVVIPDASGQAFNLNAAISKQATILLFYRGGWCPFCNKELGAIQTIRDELLKMGYQIIAISTDSPENLAKSRSEHQLGYTLLSDSDLEIAKQFGIAYKAPAAYSNILREGSKGKNTAQLLPVPSVFILDQGGVIRFEYINPDFKQRIGGDLLVSVAAALTRENAAATHTK